MPTSTTAPPAPTDMVTVADLLSRYAPDPVADPEPLTVPVSVGSLLRRESRALHALDRPVHPRGSQVRNDHVGHDEFDDDPEPRRDIGARMRRGTVAAGVLVAVGSVFGALVVNNTSLREDSGPQALGPDPAPSPLGPAPSRDEAVPTVVDPPELAATTEPLDPGQATSNSWMDMAGGGRSPADDAPADDAPADDEEQVRVIDAGESAAEAGAATAGSSVRAATTGSAESGGSTGSGRPATPVRSVAPAGSTDSGRSTGGGATDGGSTDDRSTDDRSTGGGSTDGGSTDTGRSTEPAPSSSDRSRGGLVGGTVQGVGRSVPDPVGGTVESLGSGVSSLGAGVRSATGGDDESPGAVGSVGRLAGSLL